MIQAIKANSLVVNISNTFDMNTKISKKEHPLYSIIIHYICTVNQCETVSKEKVPGKAKNRLRRLSGRVFRVNVPKVYPKAGK
jgi:hypothetical protein